MMGATEDIRYLALLTVVAFGLYRITSGAGATVGDLATFFLYAQQALQPMQFFATLYTQLQIAAAAGDRVFQFLDTEPDVQDRPDAQPLQVAGAPAVRFEHVSFRYPSDEPAVVLEDVDFETPAGATAVLVGESGAGKSTLMSLVPRFYDVHEGRVRVDGQDVREVTVRSLREAVGVVPQDPVLFTGTIRENIQYGRRGAQDENIRWAAQQANAEAFIQELDHGYDTELGERGVGLSGGQIQRIAIARAFLKNPRVLILDEPTSALDAESESLVMDALERLAEGRTTFIIAHRLSVARNADQVVVMERGRVAETGTHRELLARQGRYWQLWEAQTGNASGV
jgi:ABC-type multidrug transport system fused ATPase/permease subunit